MFDRYYLRYAGIVAVGLLCCVALIGCPGAGGGGGGGDGNGPPDGTGVTFGADVPDAADVANRPQAINPFAANANVQIPSSADFSKDLPPVGDQGNIGSCTAWAAGYAGATYSAERQYQWDEDVKAHEASPGYLYQRLLEVDTLECGGGTFISSAMELLVQEGCSSMDIVEYTDQSCPPNPSNADAANFRIGSYNRVVETDQHAIRAELAAGRIVVFGARIYDDFTEATGSRVYTGSGNFLRVDGQVAAHAMAVVGYDDDRQAFRIMNSWSPQWGDSGFLWMHYDTFDKTVFEVYSLEPAGDRVPDPDPDPDPEPPGPDLDDFITEAFQFVDNDPITRALNVYLVFFYHFDSPVFIERVTVDDPSQEPPVSQEWNTWNVDGYVYLVRPAGGQGATRQEGPDQISQFLAGEYTVILDVKTLDDTRLALAQTVTVDPLDSDDGGIEEGLCSDICMFAYDGECDDGGPGHDWALCGLGTDCSDCGVRDAGGGDRTQICSDTCLFWDDGECDDGGPGADYDACELGTDCSDCGRRDVDGGVTDAFCSDTCRFAFDGQCDDGGVGALVDACEFGTDCFDCGERTLDDLGGGGDIVIELCTDFCMFADDGECDDGGSGSDWAVCSYGTDCIDCGPRTGDDSIIDLVPACDDSCEFAFDGVCDDGGEGAEFIECELGTDCTDCGPRDGDDSIIDVEPLCDDSCSFALDGECDDGGEGAEFIECVLGTDCSDCGPRDGDECIIGVLQLCDDSCSFALDGTCDDGGEGAEFRECEWGTDCSDCGPRDLVDSCPHSGGFKKATRTFRGISVVDPTWARDLPAKPIGPDLLGANRKPVTIVAPLEKKNVSE